MQANKTVIINGRPYDAVTGLPVKHAATSPAAAPAPEKAAPKPAAKPATKPVAKPAAVKRAQPTATTAVHESGPQRARTLYHRAGKKQNLGQDVRPQTESKTVHATTQRSQTLRRASTKKPGPAKRPQPGKHMDVARSSSVSRFASHPVTKPAPAATPKPAAKPDVPHKTHPVAARAAAKTHKKSVSMPATAQQVKEVAIAKVLAPTPKPAAKNAAKKKGLKMKRSFKWTRKFTIISALFAVLVAAAAVTYVNLPILSVSLASAQAGLNATYPKYIPDGYSLSQPVTFTENKVALTFKSNAGTGEYTIEQSESSWDSSAVLENVVRKAAGDNYVTTQERGLIIYAFEGNAAWVSGGILYTIKSQAPLSSDQIRRIATSL